MSALIQFIVLYGICTFFFSVLGFGFLLSFPCALDFISHGSEYMWFGLGINAALFSVGIVPLNLVVSYGFAGQ
jgi:hypothetical protein